MSVVGLMDLGRMARTLRVNADMIQPRVDAAVVGADTAAGAPILSGIEKVAFTKSATRIADALDEQRALLSTNPVTQANDAAALLGSPRHAIEGVLDALKGIDPHQAVMKRGKLVETRSRYDLTEVAAPMRRAADELDATHARLVALDGVRQITPEGSSVVKLGDAALDHVRTQPLPSRVGARTLDDATIARYVTSFKPRTQRVIQAIYRNLVAPFVRPEHVDRHIMARAASGGHPIIATGTHMSQADAPALVHLLGEANAPAVRSLAADHVFMPGLKRVLGAGGLIGRSTQWDGGKVLGRELMPEVLRHGQGLVVFPEGTLYPFLRGAIGEPIEGTVRAAADTGTVIVPTASSGYQSSRVLGEFAKGRHPVTVVGDPYLPLAAPADASAAQRTARLFEQREVQAQLTERLAVRAWDRYAAQR